MNKFWVCLGSMLATTVGVTPVFAQSTDASYELEEVVVTAELREVNLQKVSTSIQVTSGEELRKEGKKRIDEIMAGAVGIQTQDSQNGVTFFVRGVDSGGANGVNSTPVLVDGVEQSRGEAVRGGTLDLARAEVMRGPQSTTLGANALSGAVSLVSNKPVFNYEASASLDFGNYHKTTLEGVMNVPLSDNQAVRIAYSSEKRDAYVSNGSGESDLRNVRVKYRWQPSDTLDIVGTISHQNIGGNGVSQLTLLTYGQYRPWVGGTSALNAFVPGSTLNKLSKCWESNTNSNLVDCTPANLLTGAVVDPGNSVTFLGCTPIYPALTAADPQLELQRTLGGNPDILGGCTPSFYPENDGTNFRTRSNAWDDGSKPYAWNNDPYRNSNIELASLEFNWTTDLGTVTFLPSYQYTHYTEQQPFRAYQSMGADNYQTTKIADLRINSPGGEKLVWQAGLYYSADHQKNMTNLASLPGLGMGMNGALNTGDCTLGWNAATNSFFAASNGTDPNTGIYPLLDNSLCYSYQLTPKADRTNKAAFANVEYSLLDTTRLIGGIRYSQASQDILTYPTINGNINGPYQSCPYNPANPAYPMYPCTFIAAPLGLDTTTGTYTLITDPATATNSVPMAMNNMALFTPNAQANVNWVATTYRAGLEWDMNPDTMLYGVYSTGFNPGAFDSMNSNTPAPAITLEQISAGFKSQAMDNRLQFNGEAFATTYRNRAIDGNVISAIDVSTGASVPTANCSVGMGQSGVSNSSDGLAWCLGLGTPIVEEFKSVGIDLDLTWLLTPNDRLGITAEFMNAQYDSAPVVINKPLNAMAPAGTLTCVGADGVTYSNANCPSIAGQPIYVNGKINPAYVAAIANASSPAPTPGWSGYTPEAIRLAADFDSQLNSFVGTTLQNAPKFSATWNYAHNFNLPNGDRITPRISGAYKSRYWSLGGGGPGNSGVNVIASAANDPSSPYYLAWQQAYATWDFTTTWDKADGKFTVSAYVRNLTNEVVLAGFTYQYVSLAPPRTWGATFVANF